MAHSFPWPLELSKDDGYTVPVHQFHLHRRRFRVVDWRGNYNEKDHGPIGIVRLGRGENVLAAYRCRDMLEVYAVLCELEAKRDPVPNHPDYDPRPRHK